MNGQTAADALIDAGREVATALGADSDRPTGTAATGPGGTVTVTTLLVLAVAEAPILVVGLVGYVVVAARDPDAPGSGFDDWIAIGRAGARGTVLLVGAALPAAAALVGSGLLGIEAGSVVLGSAPGPIVGVGLAALAVATWHAAVVGIVAVAMGSGWGVDRAVKFGRSAAGVRLSTALAGLVGGVAVVGFGLTALPVVGSVLAALVVAAGVAVAGRLVGRTITEAGLRGEPVGTESDGERLAVPTDGAAAVRHGTLDEDTEQRDGGERRPTGSTTTPRRSRRGRP